MDRRAIVVGAGIGGAASALLLARVGFDVALLERAAGPEPAAGTAIGLRPNGLAVLYGLGLREPLRHRAHLARAASVYLDDRLLGPRADPALQRRARERDTPAGFPSRLRRRG
jgi:2-polyprenyl-6-methoxyphenol hydroxylase-like FAD-dependent oxidoreductase